ncbi:BON domain-containing protein [Vibrio mexicanus]|uniref:BON domain-containing protein n=1 Tax=Vibrio mexicanus TaxID=1004326 RepID=UPI00063CE2ED|nr:BON domain-containing protein [Vibrio mexicanus]
MKSIKLFFVALGIALLTGCGSLPGSGDSSSSNLDPRSTRDKWNDSNIEFSIVGIGNKAPYRGQARISASSYDGTVVLIGQSSTEELLNQFEKEARSVDGVKTIHNQVRIKAPLSVTEISADSWITTKVKSALLAEKALDGLQVKVITEDKEVFLLGYVTKEQADKATEVARNISGVKQVIRAFQ